MRQLECGHDHFSWLFLWYFLGQRLPNKPSLAKLGLAETKHAESEIKEETITHQNGINC